MIPSTMRKAELTECLPFVDSLARWNSEQFKYPVVKPVIAVIDRVVIQSPMNSFIPEGMRTKAENTLMPNLTKLIDKLKEFDSMTQRLKKYLPTKSNVLNVSKMTWLAWGSSHPRPIPNTTPGTSDIVRA